MWIKMMKLLLICAVALLLGVDAKKVDKPVSHKRITQHAFRNLEKKSEKKPEAEKPEKTPEPTATPEPTSPTATMGYTAAMYRDAKTGEASFKMMPPDGVEVKPGQLLMNQCWTKTGGLFPYVKLQEENSPQEENCNVMLQSSSLFAPESMTIAPGAFPQAYGIAAEEPKAAVADFERRALQQAGAGTYLPFLSVKEATDLVLCPLPKLPVIKPTPTPAPTTTENAEGEDSNADDKAELPKTQLERSLTQLERDAGDADTDAPAPAPAADATFAACCEGKGSLVLFKFGTLEGTFEEMKAEIESMCA